MDCHCCYEEDHLTNEEKRKSLRRWDFFCSMLYILFVFGYSLAIILIAIYATKQSPIINQQYLNILSNWNLDVINDMQSSIGGNCSQGYVNMIQQTWQNQQLTQWVLPNGNKINLCYKRVAGYSFTNKYITTPKCSADSDQICGGTDSENKFCVPASVNCPINGLIITNNVSSVDQINYNLLTTLNGGYQLFRQSNQNNSSSNVSNNYQIVDFQVSYGNGVCRNRSQFVSQTSSQFYDPSDEGCGGIDHDYQLLGQISAKQFIVNNNVFNPIPQEFEEYLMRLIISSNLMVGLYVRGYVFWKMECRQILLQKVIDSQRYWIVMTQSMFALQVIAGLYFILVGIIINALQIMITCQCPIPFIVDISDVQKLRRSTIVLRVVSFVVYSVSIIMTYFFSAEINNTLSVSINQQCTSNADLVPFQQMHQEIQQWRMSIIPLFWIYIFALTFEILTSYIALYRSISNKRKNLKQEQLDDQQNYELQRLNTQNNFEKTPIFQQGRPSFNPADLLKIRISINRQSLVQTNIQNYDTNQNRNYMQKPINIIPPHEEISNSPDSHIQDRNLLSKPSNDKQPRAQNKIQQNKDPNLFQKPVKFVEAISEINTPPESYREERNMSFKPIQNRQQVVNTLSTPSNAGPKPNLKLFNQPSTDKTYGKNYSP